MSTSEMRAETHRLLDTVPEGFLLTVHNYLQELNSNEIIPELGCTLAQYNKEIDEADQEIERGEFIFHEDVVNELNEIIARKK